MAKDTRAGNGFDPKVTQGFVDELKGFVADLLSERGTYMQRCRAIREDMGTVYDRAKTAGIPTRVLKLIMKEFAAVDKLLAEREKLEEDTRETYEAVRASLGQLADTPLGQAAAKKRSPSTLDQLQ
jgi:hypothetical protein